MKKSIVFSAAVAACVASSASAQDNVGGCGWGSQVFDGDRGLAPQVLAVTTNNLVGSNTFGMSSNTAGCTRNGLVRSNMRTAMYIEENRDGLATDMSKGEGERLSALADLLGIEKAADRDAFFAVSKNSFGELFPDGDVSSKEVARSLAAVLRRDPVLSPYAAPLG